MRVTRERECATGSAIGGSAERTGWRFGHAYDLTALAIILELQHDGMETSKDKSAKTGM